MPPVCLIHCSHGPHTSSSLDKVVALPKTIRPRLARVRRTFVRRASLKKPTSPELFDRVVDTRTRSRSIPWKPSTVSTRTLRSGCHTRCCCRLLLIKSRWAEYPAMIAISLALTASSHGESKSCKRTSTMSFASAVFRRLVPSCSSAFLLPQSMSTKTTRYRPLCGHFMPEIAGLSSSLQPFPTRPP